MAHTVIISKDFTFEASHVLPRHPGKCSRLHGHSWGLTVTIAGTVDPDSGFVADYGDLKVLVMEHVINKLDHTHLGQYIMYAGDSHTDHIHASDGYRLGYIPYLGPTFYPTSENLVVAIALILQPLVRELKGHPRLLHVTIKETCTSAATWQAPTADAYEPGPHDFAQPGEWLGQH